MYRPGVLCAGRSVPGERHGRRHSATAAAVTTGSAERQSGHPTGDPLARPAARAQEPHGACGRARPGARTQEPDRSQGRRAHTQVVTCVPARRPVCRPVASRRAASAPRPGDRPPVSRSPRVSVAARSPSPRLAAITTGSGGSHTATARHARPSPARSGPRTQEPDRSHQGSRAHTQVVTCVPARRPVCQPVASQRAASASRPGDRPPPSRLPRVSVAARSPNPPLGDGRGDHHRPSGTSVGLTPDR